MENWRHCPVFPCSRGCRVVPLNGRTDKSVGPKCMRMDLGPRWIIHGSCEDVVFCISILHTQYINYYIYYALHALLTYINALFHTAFISIPLFPFRLLLHSYCFQFTSIVFFYNVPESTTNKLGDHREKSITIPTRKNEGSFAFQNVVKKSWEEICHRMCPIYLFTVVIPSNFSFCCG